jgi:hypothetical protein
MCSFPKNAHGVQGHGILKCMLSWRDGSCHVGAASMAADLSLGFDVSVVVREALDRSQAQAHRCAVAAHCTVQRSESLRARGSWRSETGRAGGRDACAGGGAYARACLWLGGNGVTRWR